ncbi:MAG: hypothetical protein WKF95_02500 [Rubrobacter sp.]
MVEGGAQGVDVALGRDLLAAELLRGGVRRRPEVGAGTRLLGGVKGAGYTEISQLRVAALVQKHVPGLDVAVDHAALVGVGEGGGHVRAHPREHPLGQGAAPVHERLQVPARRVLHDDVGDLTPVQEVLPRVVDLNDVGVGEPGRRATLAAEKGARLLVVEVGVQDLDGHRTVENLVAA